MTRILPKIVSAAVAVFFVSGWMYARQSVANPEPAGLESDRQYAALMEEDKLLQLREDSIAMAMEFLRARLRTEPEARSRISEEILQLENRMFAVRNAKGRLVDRINALEQEWVLARLEGADSSIETEVADTGSDAVLPAVGPKVRNLVYNGYFRENLPESEYAVLLRAQSLEFRAMELVNRYFANYDSLALLARSYEAATVEDEAVAIYKRFHVLTDTNRLLADSLAKVWNYVFDNKSYAYGYLLDKIDHDRLLAEQESRLTEAMQRLAGLRDRTISDKVADYCVRKGVALDYEMDMARLLGLDAARDSLSVVRKQVEAVDFCVPEIEIVERFFVDYDSLAFSKTPHYDARHPIPECRIYARGTIYRILLGTFNAKRPVSIFKGAYPLSYLIDNDGKWNYYAGGFATLAEAEAAQQLLKKKGFIRPEIVVWKHGAVRNLSQQPDTDGPMFRVEVLGAAELSQPIRAAIVAVAADAEVSKVGRNLFVVGLFPDKETAEAVAEAIRRKDAELEIKVAEAAR
ncbi:MAG: SPOR domain-containing protein [Alistipes senegalensis]|nr:SPOR domain-containing protein [Bacteroides cellulosilyticus]MCM1351143.1 SPOR domain-containing protein [Alistipes senegalensis]